MKIMLLGLGGTNYILHGKYGWKLSLKLKKLGLPLITMVEKTRKIDLISPVFFFFPFFTAQPGYIIQLDFRNKFHIEPSANCEYDYLEVNLCNCSIYSI